MVLVSTSGGVVPLLGPYVDPLNVPYELPLDEVPMLNSFMFTRGGQAEVNMIRVMPGGNAVDLDSESGVTIEAVDDDHIAMMLFDSTIAGGDWDAGTDDYLFRVAHAQIKDLPATRYRVSGRCSGGRCSRDISAVLPPPGGPPRRRPGSSYIYVLCGFSLSFEGSRDHRIDEIEVSLRDDGNLVVALNDKNNDDPFTYVVDFARIEVKRGFWISAGEASGYDEFHTHAPIPRSSHAEIALRGFRLQFRQPIDFDWPDRVVGDRRIARVGVMQIDDEVQVFLRDNDGWEEIEWTVRWATIGPQVASPGQ